MTAALTTTTPSPLRSKLKDYAHRAASMLLKVPGHTTDYRVMLEEAIKTEMHAARSYKEFLAQPGLDQELFDAIEQIYLAEERSVDELRQLMTT